MGRSAIDSINQAFEAGDLAEAERRIEANWNRLQPWARLTQPFRLAVGLKDHRRAKALATRAVETFPERAQSHAMLALCSLDAGRPEEALKTCEDALARFPSDARLLRRAKAAARALNRPDETIAYLRRLLDTEVANAADHVELGQLLLWTYRPAQALESFKRALAMGAPRRSLLVNLAWAAEHVGRFEEALEYWSEAEAERPEDAALAREGIRRANLRLHPRPAKGRPSEVAGGLEDFAAELGRESRVLVSAASDLKVWRRPGATEVVLVFGGLPSMMGVAPPAPPKALTRYARINIVSFSDPRRGLMMSGLPSLGADYAETLAGLRRLLEAWGTTRILVLGYSAGGYPALRYGTDLGAERVLLMSGWIELTLADQGPLLASLVDSVGHMYEDPRDLLARAPETEVILAYGDSNVRDEAHAQTLNGVPRVTLRPLHGVASHSLALEDAHDALLAEFLAA